MNLIGGISISFLFFHAVINYLLLDARKHEPIDVIHRRSSTGSRCRETSGKGIGRGTAGEVASTTKAWRTLGNGRRSNVRLRPKARGKPLSHRRLLRRQARISSTRAQRIGRPLRRAARRSFRVLVQGPSRKRLWILRRQARGTRPATGPMHAYRHAHARAQARARTQARTHTDTHTHTHAHARAHTCTRAHTHTRAY